MAAAAGCAGGAAQALTAAVEGVGADDRRFLRRRRLHRADLGAGAPDGEHADLDAGGRTGAGRHHPTSHPPQRLPAHLRRALHDRAGPQVEHDDPVGDGVPSVYWSSAYHYRGGVRPSPEIEARRRRASACGVMVLDAATCTAVPLPLERMLWSGAHSGQPGGNRCDSLSPGRDLPAFAASESPPAKDLAPQLTVEVVSDRQGCRTLHHQTPVARFGDQTLWKFQLYDFESFYPPP